MTHADPIRRCSICPEPHHARGFCRKHYGRQHSRGLFCDTEPATIPSGIIRPDMLGIVPGQPPTDPALTPATVWAIAHRNAARATCWLVNKGHMGPDEAAALAYLTYAPPAERAAA